MGEMWPFPKKYSSYFLFLEKEEGHKKGVGTTPIVAMTLNKKVDTLEAVELPSFRPKPGLLFSCHFHLHLLKEYFLFSKFSRKRTHGIDSSR